MVNSLQSTDSENSESSEDLTDYGLQTCLMHRITQKSLSNERLSAVRTGLEPVTPCVTGMYSNQLN